MARLSLIYESAQYKYNLITNFDETLEAMAKLEGDHWLERVLEGKNETFNDAIEALKEGPGMFDEPDDTVTSIYGDGGWNRYIVFFNGNVEYSKRHGPAQADDARVLGFKMF